MTIQKHILIFSICFFLLPATVSAATVSLRSTPESVGMGDVVLVSVLLDSVVPTNAFSGSILYSHTILEPVAINDGNSIINIWITRPDASVGDPIEFAGITPGGFSGTGGILFSVLFRATAAGRADVSFKDVEVLRNDGAGGKEPTTTRPLSLSISPSSSGGYTEPVDNTPPEAFTAYQNSDPELFDGQNYIIFTTVDKGVGIDRYAISETRLPAFLHSLFPITWNSPATSPYILSDQNLTSTVYIKAVDRAGNERISVSPPKHLFAEYEKTVLLGILIVVVLLWQMIGWGRRRRKNL